MKQTDEEQWLLHKGVKPTANRVLVLKALVAAQQPKGLAELEAYLDTMDKSSIFRVLNLFVKHEVVHAFEDGKGVLKYELCTAHGACENHDVHMHFYCESCRQTFCLKMLEVPHLNLPEGYTLHSVNFVVKGECPDCQKRNKQHGSDKAK